MSIGRQKEIKQSVIFILGKLFDFMQGSVDYANFGLGFVILDIVDFTQHAAEALM
jgi:hypothetical protein